MSETTALITGTWVDANGFPKKYDRVAVSVTRIGTTFHFDIEESGRGSVTMAGNDGHGKFTTRSGIMLAIVFETTRGETRYRLRDGLVQVATGIVYDLPP